jgi:hypothetical protein
VRKFRGVPPPHRHVDHNPGAAYEYPNFFKVRMGGYMTIEPEQNKPQATAE